MNAVSEMLKKKENENNELQFENKKLKKTIEDLNNKLSANETSLKQYNDSETKLKNELLEIRANAKLDKQMISNLEKQISKLEEKLKLKEEEIDELQRDETMRMQELENAISNCLKSKRKYPKKAQIDN